MDADDITPGDLLVIAPFAWVMAQSVIYFDIFWFLFAFWLFNTYAKKRSNRYE